MLTGTGQFVEMCKFLCGVADHCCKSCNDKVRIKVFKNGFYAPEYIPLYNSILGGGKYSEPRVWG